jgi:hypothetical protein
MHAKVEGEGQKDLMEGFSEMHILTIKCANCTDQVVVVIGPVNDIVRISVVLSKDIRDRRIE